MGRGASASGRDVGGREARRETAKTDLLGRPK